MNEQNQDFEIFEAWGNLLREMSPKSSRTADCLIIPRLIEAEEAEQGGYLSESEKAHLESCPYCQRALKRLRYHSPSVGEVVIGWARRQKERLLEVVSQLRPEPVISKEKLQEVLFRYLVPAEQLAGAPEAPETTEPGLTVEPITFEDRIAILPQVIRKEKGFDLRLSLFTLKGEEPLDVAEGTAVSLVREGTLVAEECADEYGQVDFSDLAPGRYEVSFDAYPRAVFVLELPPV